MEKIYLFALCWIHEIFLIFEQRWCLPYTHCTRKITWCSIQRHVIVIARLRAIRFRWAIFFKRHFFMWKYKLCKMVLDKFYKLCATQYALVRALSHCLEKWHPLNAFFTKISQSLCTHPNPILEARKKLECYALIVSTCSEVHVSNDEKISFS